MSERPKIAIYVDVQNDFHQIPELQRINRLIVALLESGLSEKDILERLHTPGKTRLIAIDPRHLSGNEMQR